MTIFTEAEIEYLNDQFIGRFATIGPGGKPQVTPVGVFFDPDADTVVISGTNLATSQKFRNVIDRPDASLVIDDIAAVNPWTPRGIEIRGKAEPHREGGEAVGKRINANLPFDSAWILLRPRRILSWGIDSSTQAARDVGSHSTTQTTP